MMFDSEPGSVKGALNRIVLQDNHMPIIASPVSTALQGSFHIPLSKFVSSLRARGSYLRSTNQSCKKYRSIRRLVVLKELLDQSIYLLMCTKKYSVSNVYQNKQKKESIRWIFHEKKKIFYYE